MRRIIRLSVPRIKTFHDGIGQGGRRRRRRGPGDAEGLSESLVESSRRRGRSAETALFDVEEKRDPVHAASVSMDSC